MKQVNTKSVGLFVLLPAPLNPIGAFDAESFKADFRSVVESNADAKFVGVDLRGIDFVYSDAYNAFMQIHQELSSKNGVFAVLADKESLVTSLRKVGLERFIRIFASEEEMAAYLPVEAKVAADQSKDEAPVAPQTAPVVEEKAPAPQETVVQATPAPEKIASQPRIMETNPLVDDTSSSRGAAVIVIVLILIAIVAVSYLVL